MTPLPRGQLIQRYRTSKATASKAVALLQAEGLVTTELGRGTFVRNRPPLRRVSAAKRHGEHRSSGRPIFDTEALAQGQARPWESRRSAELNSRWRPPNCREELPWRGISAYGNGYNYSNVANLP